MPGTDVLHGATGLMRTMPGTDVVHDAICLRVRYAMPVLYGNICRPFHYKMLGTELACAGTRPRTALGRGEQYLSSSALARRFAVLT
eukprot:723530-Rhodomonas_salina.2